MGVLKPNSNSPMCGRYLELRVEVSTKVLCGVWIKVKSTPATLSVKPCSASIKALCAEMDNVANANIAVSISFFIMKTYF